MSAAPQVPGRAPLVAGVDGCRTGWVVVLRRLDAPELTVRVVATFAEVIAMPEVAMIAVDIPIGLPEIAGRGGRPADVEARSRLGARQSSVFAVPSRAAVMTEDYRVACGVAAATSDPPRRIAKQTYHLFPKIREVDRCLTPTLQQRVREVHPELAFWALNGGRPLSEPKKVKSRPHGPGMELRLALLAAAGLDTTSLSKPLAGAGADDILDAAANAWSAGRMLRGDALRLPANPERDARGLSMEIWA